MKNDIKKDMLHEKREFTDVRHLVEECCELYKDRIAYSFRKKASDKEKVEITFAKVRDDVRALTTEFLSRVADAQSEPAPADEPRQETPAQEPARPSRVGSMFEQLSFGDVD